MSNIQMQKKMKDGFDEKTFKLVKDIGALADKYSFRAYIVGGMVRDIFLNRKTVDVDVVVLGNGMKFAKIIADELKGAYKEFEKFKTAKIFFKNNWVDISSARAETYEKSGALPTVSLSSLKEDLYRRDFTINSMAISINKDNFGELFDYFCGTLDMNNKILRTMHDKSFIDDPTRILRAIRFETRFGFKIEKRTLDLLQNSLRHNIFNNLSGERLREELFRIFDEPSPLKAIKRLKILGVLTKINPNIQVDLPSFKLFSIIASSRKLIIGYKAQLRNLYLMALLENMQINEVEKITKMLKLSNEQKVAITHSIELQQLPKRGLSDISQSDSGLYFLLQKYNTEAIIYFMLMQNNKKQTLGIKRFIDKLQYVKIQVGGADLKDFGLKQGPEYKHILDLVLKAKLDGEVDNREEQLRLIKRILKGQ
ncbi:MAG: hypothetical protein WCJ94_00320 [bacterium]